MNTPIYNQTCRDHGIVRVPRPLGQYGAPRLETLPPLTTTGGSR